MGEPRKECDIRQGSSVQPLTGLTATGCLLIALQAAGAASPPLKWDLSSATVGPPQVVSRSHRYKKSR